MRTVVLNGKRRLCLFALKEIKVNEEIVYDYGVDDLPWRKQVNKLLLKNDKFCIN